VENRKQIAIVLARRRTAAVELLGGNPLLLLRRVEVDRLRGLGGGFEGVGGEPRSFLLAVVELPPVFLA
jgi:hypothetical protein